MTDNNINFDWYKEQVQRTYNSKDKDADLVHSALGLVTEAGEVADVAKKMIAYGKIPDEVNIQEELGDLMFYLADICTKRGYSFANILTTNIKKLENRYPEKFTNEAALNRDLTAERNTLEENLKVDEPQEERSFS